MLEGREKRPDQTWGNQMLLRIRAECLASGGGGGLGGGGMGLVRSQGREIADNLSFLPVPSNPDHSLKQ